MTEKTCSVCSRKISLRANPSGLVFDDKHFVCEDCCTDHSQEEMGNFSKSIMQSNDSGMPIGLWLIHEQNKDKTMLFSTKK